MKVDFKIVTSDKELMKIPAVRKWLKECEKLIARELEKHTIKKGSKS